MIVAFMQPIISNAQNKSVFWSVTTANNFIKKFPDPDSICWRSKSTNFDWQAGYAMFAMEKMWKTTSEIRYFNYIKRYVDQQVDEADRRRVSQFNTSYPEFGWLG
jgi:rhamnogalacturonyl hydrolase YesR